MTKISHRPLAAAVLAAGLCLLARDAHSAPGVQDELINRPTGPYLCLTREGRDLERHEPWLSQAQGRCRNFGTD
jgi:hypothetical protein